MPLQSPSPASNTPVAVLTGDLIGSRKRDARTTDESLATLANAAKKLEFLHNLQNQHLRFTRSRGDSWQVLLENPRYVLEACIALTARLRAAGTGLETRIAVGIGQLENAGTTDLSDAAGSAFHISGDLLKRMTSQKKSERWMIDGPSITEWQRAVFSLGSWIARGWTAQQAEAVAMVISEPNLHTNENRASTLGISRQAFEARLKGSGLEHFYHAHQAFVSHDFETAARS